jgi:hypothetical protein
MGETGSLHRDQARILSALNCVRCDDRESTNAPDLSFTGWLVKNTAARVRLAGTVTSLYLTVLMPLH